LLLKLAKLLIDSDTSSADDLDFELFWKGVRDHRFETCDEEKNLILDIRLVKEYSEEYCHNPIKPKFTIVRYDGLNTFVSFSTIFEQSRHSHGAPNERLLQPEPSHSLQDFNILISSRL